MRQIRGSFYCLIEQPSGSWGFKTPDMSELISEMGLLLVRSSMFDIHIDERCWKSTEQYWNI